MRDRQPELWVLILVFFISSTSVLVSDFSFYNTKIALECASLFVLGVMYAQLGYTFVVKHYTKYNKIHFLLAQCIGLLCIFLLFNFVGSVLDYVLTGSFVFPEWDSVFVKWDADIGFQWLAWYTFVMQHHWLHTLLANAYSMAALELMLWLVVLPLIGDILIARLLVIRYMAIALITMIVGVVMPAVGGFAFYHLPIAAKIGYIPVMHGLRDGSLRVINMNNIQGLVVFPSFHAAIATMCILSTWHWKHLRLPIFLLNLCILISTPTEGGHYAVDALAGMSLTFLVYYIINPKRYKKWSRYEEQTFDDKEYA